VRLVLQRVSSASVGVDGAVVGSIGPGLVALLAIASDDDQATLTAAAERVANLRVFPARGKPLDRSLLETGYACLVVSQFTLLADLSGGRRPSFFAAAPPEQAAPLVAHFAAWLGVLGVPVQQGVFGATMQVSLTNDGPVTLVLD
jgi:D-tyrosyl-tRNA(Tyr) deacylase